MKIIEDIKVSIYSVSMYIVFFNIGLGTIQDIMLLFKIGDNFIRLIIAVHALMMWPVYIFWFKYISPNYYDTPKAPVYLIFMAWYNTFFAFIFSKDGFWNIEHYGEYDTSSIIFLLLCGSSFFFLWYWDKIKERIDYSFR